MVDFAMLPTEGLTSELPPPSSDATTLSPELRKQHPVGAREGMGKEGGGDNAGVDEAVQM